MDEQHLSLKAGEFLFQQGDVSKWAYKLLSGELRTVLNFDAGSTVLGIISAGDVVGEMGVLHKTRRCLSVKATQDCKLVGFKREAFIETVTANRKLSLEVIRLSCMRARTLLDVVEDLLDEQRALFHKAQSIKVVEDLFRFLRERLVRAREKQENRASRTVAKVGKTKLLRAGGVLFHEGADSPWASRVLRGRLLAKKKVHSEWVTLGEIKPGQFAGELGLLLGRKRGATVLAKEDSELEMLGEELLLDRLVRDPKCARRAMLDASDRAIRLASFVSSLIDTLESSSSSISGRVATITRSAKDVVSLAGDVLESDLKRLRGIMGQEAKNVKSMVLTYHLFVRGRASQEEMDEANGAFRNLLKTVGLGTLFLLPGGLVSLPVAVKLGARFGIDVLPRFDEDQLPI